MVPKRFGFSDSFEGVTGYSLNQLGGPEKQFAIQLEQLLELSPASGRELDIHLLDQSSAILRN
jgi:hypothetical protein